MSNILRFLALLFVAALVLLLLGPAMPLERDFEGLDKIAHFGAFGGLLWSFGVLFRRQSRILLALYALVFGIMTEIAQGLLGRDASWLDLLADACGILAALLLWAICRGFQPRRLLASKPTEQSGSRPA